MRPRVALLAGAGALGILALVRAQPPQDLVGLLVEPLHGEGTIGRRAATFLHLQVWRTLRKSPPDNVHHLDFGNGIAYWDEIEAPPRTHAEAAQRADSLSSPLHAVLWGTANRYGGGVVVQAYLTITHPRTPGSPGSKIWSAPAGSAASPRTVTVDLPSWSYEFAPIVLRPEVIPELNTPEGIPMYDDSLTRRVGSLLSDFRGVEQGPDLAKVNSGGKVGWVKLPALSKTRSEVTDFAGAIVRLFRQDWMGAVTLLESVVQNTRAPVSLRTDSYLLMAAASSRYSRQTGAADESLRYISAAEKLNPFLQAVVRYKCMGLLARVERPPAASDRPAAWKEIGETIRRNEYLFARDDRWIVNLRADAERNLHGQ